MVILLMLVILAFNMPSVTFGRQERAELEYFKEFEHFTVAKFEHFTVASFLF